MKEQEYGLGPEQIVYGWETERQEVNPRAMKYICGELEVEDLKHFLMECKKLEEIRGGSVELQRPRMERVEGAMGAFLFGEGNSERRKNVLLRM